MVTLIELPAVVLGGASTMKRIAAAGSTVMVLEVPLIELVPVSVAAIVSGPGVLSCAERTPMPLVNVLSAGSTAWGSLDAKLTVPE
jgi:hypothetical protein